MPVDNPVTITEISTLFYDLFVSYGLGSQTLAGLALLFILAYIGRKMRWSFDTYIVVFIPFLIWLGVSLVPVNFIAYVGLGGAFILAWALWKFWGR